MDAEERILSLEQRVKALEGQVRGLLARDAETHAAEQGMLDILQGHGLRPILSK